MSIDITKNLQNKELQLFYKWKQTGDNNIKLELINSLSPIIYQQVHKFKGSGLPETALRLETKRIISDALETYDPTKSQLNTHVINYGKKLSRFVQNYQNVGKIPEPRLRMVGLYNTVYDNINADKGREPTVPELADAMSVPSIEIERLQTELRSDLGMPDVGAGVEEDSFLDLTQFTDLKFHERQIIEFVYYDSDPIDKKVIEYIFGLGGVIPLKSDKEIAFKLNLTPSALKRRKTKLGKRLTEAGIKDLH